MMHIRAPEERHCGSADERAVGDLALVREVLRGLDGRGHALDGEEGGEVGGVGGDEDGREEPPDPRDDARRRRLRVQVGTAARREVRIHSGVRRDVEKES